MPHFLDPARTQLLMFRFQIFLSRCVPLHKHTHLRSLTLTHTHSLPPLSHKKRAATLAAEREGMERAMLAQSEQAQTLQQEVHLLRSQLHQALAAADQSNAAQTPQHSEDVALDLGTDELPTIQGTPSKGARGDRGDRVSSASRGGARSVLGQLADRPALQGLVNCMQLVTDGRVGRRGSVVYLAVLHVMLLYITVAYFRFQC